MNNFKQTFPHIVALRSQIVKQWGNFDEEIKEAVGPLEAEFKRVKKRQKIGGLCIAGVIGLLYILDAIGDSDMSLSGLLGDVVALILTILFLPIMIGLGILGWRLLRDKNNVVARFNTGIDRLIFPKVLSVFGLSGAFVEPTITPPSKGGSSGDTASWIDQLRQLSERTFTATEHQQVMDLLDHSELVTEPRNRVKMDDMITIKWGSGTLFVSELDLKHVTGSGKNRKVKKVFSGYFVSLDLDKQLTGKTFVSTEGDKKGFGHQSFWKNLKGSNLEVTELEWNEFENLLHVATTDPTEARYILTTNFMADLYDWWKDKKSNIRIAFIGSRMYLLFPDKSIRFSNTVPKINTYELQEYAMTIATPLMHVLHLAEDVRDRK